MDWEKILSKHDTKKRYQALLEARIPSPLWSKCHDCNDIFLKVILVLVVVDYCFGWYGGGRGGDIIHGGGT